MHKPSHKMRIYSHSQEHVKTYHLHYTNNLNLEGFLYHSLSHNGACLYGILGQSCSKIGAKMCYGPPGPMG